MEYLQTLKDEMVKWTEVGEQGNENSIPRIEHIRLMENDRRIIEEKMFIQFKSMEEKFESRLEVALQTIRLLQQHQQEIELRPSPPPPVDMTSIHELLEKFNQRLTQSELTVQVPIQVEAPVYPVEWDLEWQQLKEQVQMSMHEISWLRDGQNSSYGEIHMLNKEIDLLGQQHQILLQNQNSQTQLISKAIST